jgi:hypothetical protein
MPVVVEYKVAEMGHIRFYLAPKLEEEENQTQVQARPQADMKPEVGTEDDFSLWNLSAVSLLIISTSISIAICCVQFMQGGGPRNLCCIEKII